MYIYISLCKKQYVYNDLHTFVKRSIQSSSKCSFVARQMATKSPILGRCSTPLTSSGRCGHHPLGTNSVLTVVTGMDVMISC